MAEILEQPVLETSADTDLVTAVRQVLQGSSEPLTLVKIRAALPAALRARSLENLAENLHRQVTANILYLFPKYRSQHDRFWDRPMSVHLAQLLHKVVQDGPLPWSAIRRQLPGYAKSQAEPVLEEQLAKGQMFRHPAQGKRGGTRFSSRRPCPKDFLRGELASLFGRLGQLGFTQPQLREAALELLHEEEWSMMPPPAASTTAPTASAEPPAAASETLLDETSVAVAGS